MDRYPNLDIKQDWPRILSLGEQQRLAFARLLLNSPRFAVLDEATSALDINTEKKLYSLLKERELSLISVGHRPSLKDFHENILELNGQGDWKLLTSDKYNLRFNKKMNSKEEQTNSEVTNLENESFIEQQKDPNYINEQIEDNKLDEKL